VVTITICCPEWSNIKYTWMPSPDYQNTDILRSLHRMQSHNKTKNWHKERILSVPESIGSATCIRLRFKIKQSVTHQNWKTVDQGRDISLFLTGHLNKHYNKYIYKEVLLCKHEAQLPLQVNLVFHSNIYILFSSVHSSLFSRFIILLQATEAHRFVRHQGS
jgi:hypothetical protein